MLVTDKQYFIEKKLLKKLILMIKRMEGTDDNILIIDGDEGQGKTELSMGICYFVAYHMGRKYNIDHVFFDLDEVIKFASSTKEQIIHFDEGALGLLLTQWQSKTQQKFIQLVMTARKKKHFIVICIPKFHRLPQYVIEERSIGLIHVYSRKNMEKGRFCYFNKEKKERLYQDWIKNKIKTYKKHLDFGGTFPECSKVIFTKEEMQKYDNKKDEAIMSITKEKISKQQSVWLEQRNNLISGIKEHLNMGAEDVKLLFEKFGVNISTTQIKDITRLNRKQKNGEI